MSELGNSPFTIGLTGSEDYSKTINQALCGFAGSGKTIFASTAPSPFYIVFKEKPQIMSIADRYMPIAKVLTQYNLDKTKVITPVWDVLLKLVMWLESDKGSGFETIVVDTGDELFKAMKATRKVMNMGKFPIGDWDWIAESFRGIMARILDMDKNVIVNFHLKNTQAGEDGEIVRELALQGQVKDEAPEWFDLVGVLDSWEEATDSGKVTRRGMLTKSTPTYPFVKDHSGKLPKVFPISDDFVGDYKRMSELIFEHVPQTGRQVIDTIDMDDVVESLPDDVSVPTPEDVKDKKGIAKKTTKKGAANATDESGPEKDPAPAKSAKADEGTEPADQGTVDGGDEPAKPISKEDTPVPESEEATDLDGAAEEVAKQLGGTVEAPICHECGGPVVKKLLDAVGGPVLEDGEPVWVADNDLANLTMIRYRKNLCRTHYDEVKAKG